MSTKLLLRISGCAIMGLFSVAASQASQTPNRISSHSLVIDSTQSERDSVILQTTHGGYPTAPGALQTELGASYSYLDNKGYTPWESAYLEATYPFGYRKTVYGHLEYLRQFDLNDGDIFAGIYYPLLTNLTAVVEGEFGFAHKITPLWSLFGQLEYKLFPGFVLGAGLRNSEYRDAANQPNEVQLVNITAEYWFAYYRLMYTFYESRGNGGLWNPPSHLLEVGYYYGDANNINLGASIGHEVERISPSGDLATGAIPLFLNTYDTRSLFLLGRHWLSAAWGMSYELGWHQENFASNTLYNRYEIRLGVRHRF